MGGTSQQRSTTGSSREATTELEKLKKSSPESILEELRKHDDLFKSVQWTTTTTVVPKTKRKRPSCIGAGRRNSK